MGIINLLFHIFIFKLTNKMQNNNLLLTYINSPIETLIKTYYI